MSHLLLPSLSVCVDLSSPASHTACIVPATVGHPKTADPEAGLVVQVGAVAAAVQANLSTTAAGASTNTVDATGCTAAGVVVV